MHCKIIDFETLTYFIDIFYKNNQFIYFPWINKRKHLTNGKETYFQNFYLAYYSFVDNSLKYNTIHEFLVLHKTGFDLTEMNRSIVLQTALSGYLYEKKFIKKNKTDADKLGLLL